MLLPGGGGGDDHESLRVIPLIASLGVLVLSELAVAAFFAYSSGSLDQQYNYGLHGGSVSPTVSPTHWSGGVTTLEGRPGMDFLCAPHVPF